MAGGGDVDPDRYGGDCAHEAVHDVDLVQDEAEFSLARHCLDAGVPTLAVCCALHVMNVVRGGTLVIDMPEHHRHTVQRVPVDLMRRLVASAGS